MKRIWLLLVVVFLIPIVPWLIIGAPLESWIEGVLRDSAAAGYRQWGAALLGLTVLAGDSFLPVPSTIVMSLLGLAFGVFLGGVLASVGLSLSGLVAYGLCRRFGVGIARRIAGETGLERVRNTMTRLGPITIAVTRSVPVLQEATSCLAGLAQMPARKYVPALLAGCIPTGFAYAAIGASALVSERAAVVLSIAIPAVSWPLIYLALRSGRGAKQGAEKI